MGCIQLVVVCRIKGVDIIFRPLSIAHMQVDLPMNKVDACTLNIQRRWYIMRLLSAAIKGILLTQCMWQYFCIH